MVLSVLLSLSLPNYAQKNGQLPTDTIIISGIVKDAESREPMTFVTVFLVGSSDITALTDEAGRYELTFLREQTADSIEFRYLGYESKRFKVRDGKRQEINLVLKPETTVLQQAVVTAKRRQKIPKDTLALQLWRNVVKHKVENQIFAAESFRYEDYTKIQFNLARVSDAVSRNKFLNKHLGVAMNSLQLNYQGDKYLPGLLKETAMDVYYRKKNKAFRKIVKADRLSGFPNETISSFVSEELEEINPYEDLIVIFGKSIAGPFAKGSNTFYRYFLTDTIQIDSLNRHYKLEFVAKRPGDISFLGWALIDSASFAIVKIDFDIPTNSGINFIKGYKVEQEYERVGKYWAMVKGRNIAEVHIPERLTLFRLSYDRHTSRRNYSLDTPIPDTMFNSDKIVRLDSSYNRSETQWASDYRHDTIRQLEEHIYFMVDSIQRTPLYRSLEKFGYFLTSGRVRLGPIDIGRIAEMVSWNTLEGVRLKVGLRTNPKFSKRFQLSLYGAYGISDKEFKYGLSTTLHLNKPGKRWRSLLFQYKYDFEFLGQLTKTMSHDNLTAVVSRRTPFNRLMKIRDIALFYTHDWFNGFYNILSVRRRTFYSVPGVFDFTTGENQTPVPDFNTFEIQLTTHWGIGEKFFSDGFTRTTLGTKKPIFELEYTAGIKGVLGSDYGYHKLVFSMKQRLNSVLGFTHYKITAGKTFGDAPYPLLTIHLGNQSWFHNRNAFNMMREFEYVSDTYASLTVEHHFDGLLFNTIPGFRRLGWREVLIGKVLWGQLSPHNRQLINMPESINAPNWYAEVGFGVENIFSLFRIDFLWRLTPPYDANYADPKSYMGYGKSFGIKLSIEPRF